MKADVQSRLADVQNAITRAAQRSGRTAGDVTLIAVTKTHSVETIRAAINAGVFEVGENRVQEAEAKIEAIGHGSVKWHMIGPLQANKARRAVKLFDMIHSVDSIELARRLERLCVEEGRKELPFLVQVDLGHEPSKSGIAEEELPSVIKEMSGMRRVKAVGLMTLPPFFADPQLTRPFFRRMRVLCDELRAGGYFNQIEIPHLSMGMSHDFEVAIEEGATMVRVGTAIFGERS
ncbi:MAG: YggS family pyridoxal phosphate-dependent enzyme [Pyrinomonadaceae bacterium]